MHLGRLYSQPVLMRLLRLASVVPQVPTPSSATVPMSLPSPPSSEGTAPSTMTGAGAFDGNGDNLTRAERVQRYREKRKNRKFEKTIRYASRKAYAEVS